MYATIHPPRDLSRFALPLLVMLAVGCGRPSLDDGPAAGGSGVDSEVPRSFEIELVGPGIVSTERNQTFPFEDPVDGSLWYSEYDDGFDEQTIVVARREGGTWLAPVLAPFSGRWGDRAPRLTPDGSTLYFTSNRPVDPGEEPGQMNLWRVTRTEAGWSSPERVPAPVGSNGPDIHPSITDSAIWIPSAREGTLGRSDVFRVPFGSREAQHLPAPVNSELSQPDIYVSRDERWMVLTITDHPEGLGGDDLYLSRRGADGWSTPTNLGAPINSPEYEYGASLSADGRWLYFTSHRSGSASVYRVSAEVVEARLEAMEGR